QEHVKDWARLVAEFAVTVDDGAYAALVLVPDSGFGIAEQRGGILRLDFLQLLRQRKALLCRGIAELVISRQDQASDSVARGADTGEVAPAIPRVGYVNAVRAAMTTAPWVEIYRVGGERDGLAHMLRQHPFTKSGGDGVCRLGAVAVTERVRQPL